MQVGPARPRGAASRDQQRRGGSRCQAAGFEDTNRGHWPRTADGSARRERPGSGVSPRASGRDAALLTRGFRPGGPVPGFRPADGDDCPASLRLSGEHGFPLCLCLTSRTIPSPVPLSQMARTRGAVTAGPAAPRVPGRGPPGALPTGHGLEDSRQTERGDPADSAWAAARTQTRGGSAPLVACLGSLGGAGAGHAVGQRKSHPRRTRVFVFNVY